MGKVFNGLVKMVAGRPKDKWKEPERDRNPDKDKK